MKFCREAVLMSDSVAVSLLMKDEPDTLKSCVQAPAVAINEKIAVNMVPKQHLEKEILLFITVLIEG